MFSGSEGQRSVDSLPSLSGVTHKADFPFHRSYASSSYAQQRRGSTASSIHSVGGTLDTVIGGGWTETVAELGQNAISTLLQPPIVRTGLQPHTSAPAHSAHKPPTAKDIPPVTLTNISHIEASEFTDYLTQVGALHEQLRRVKESEDEQAATTSSAPRRPSSRDDSGDPLGDSFLRPHGKRPSLTRKASVSSISSLSLAETSSPRRSSSHGRRGNQGPPPLSTIPSVYFDEDFHLENPRTFDVVSERSEVVPSAAPANNEKNGDSGKNGISVVAPPVPRKALATNAILQEKLSWYMDTVEMHLISSISTASTAFFTALGSLKELHTEAADSVDRIQALRTELTALDGEIATRGLEVVQKQRRWQNIHQFHAVVMQLKDVVADVAACEAMVDDGNVDKALDAIDALEKFIAGDQDQKLRQKRRPYPLRDLRGATALQGINDDIVALRIRIGKAYEAKFVAVLLRDLRQHFETASRQEVLMRWSSSSMRNRGGLRRDPSALPSYVLNTDDLRRELRPILLGLTRAKHITAASQAFREAVIREIKKLVRKPLPSSNDDDNESMMSSSTVGGGRTRSQAEKSSILARHLRVLEPEDAEEVLVKVYMGVAETLRRLTTQAKVLLDVASSVGEDDSEAARESAAAAARARAFSPTGRQQMTRSMSDAALETQAELHRALDMSSLLGQLIDTAQDKVVRVLRVRAEQSSRLSLAWFLRYFTLNLLFTDECEAISGRSGTALKTEVNGHVRDFVQHHGDAERQKLAQGMELDQWAAKDFTDKDTKLLQRILDASTKEIDAWKETVTIWQPYSAEDEDDLSRPPSNGTSAATAAAATAATAAGGAGGKPKVHGAVVDAETFLLPHSAMLCLQGMSCFMHLAVAIPFMASDVAASLVQYLQLYNSRCTQLILGAGATRSAGLKNITTRHLAVASQSLAFLAALIPYVREFMRRRLGQSLGGASSNSGINNSNGNGGGGSPSIMGEFDKVRRLYQEHQNSIYDKLVDIMGGRAQAHAKTMRGIDWDASDASTPVHAYMDTLVKETSTLHRNLAKTLPEATVRFIMTSVFAGYKEQVGGVLRTAEVKTVAGRESMLRDVESFQVRLSKIDGFGDSGDYFRGIVGTKISKEKTPSPPPPKADSPPPPPPKTDSPPPPPPPAKTPTPPPAAVPPKEEENMVEDKEEDKDKADNKDASSETKDAENSPAVDNGNNDGKETSAQTEIEEPSGDSSGNKDDSGGADKQ